METKTHSPQFLRRRKFLMVAPILVLPFITVIFWALGGGKPDKKQDLSQVQKGLNMNLPGAHLKDDKGVDKMAYYNQADLDSAKLKERLKNEALYGQKMDGPDSDSQAPVTIHTLPVPDRDKGILGYRDANEEKVYRKLGELDLALNKATGTQPEKQVGPPVHDVLPSEQVDRLEKMLNAAKGGNEQNPELEQMNGVLDKLFAVQHPEIARDSVKELSQKNKTSVFPVERSLGESTVTILSRADTPKKPANAFFSGDVALEPISAQNTVEAIVPSLQTIVTGATVKLQLLNDVFVTGVLIPKGTFVYGTASLNNERLGVLIHSIKFANNIFPVSLMAFDEDGVAGIYIPGAISRDVAKQSADEGLNSMGIASLDPSVTAQATTAGIQMAKSILSKKVRLIRVTINAGYRVWLKSAENN